MPSRIPVVFRIVDWRENRVISRLHHIANIKKAGSQLVLTHHSMHKLTVILKFKLTLFRAFLLFQLFFAFFLVYFSAFIQYFIRVPIYLGKYFARPYLIFDRQRLPRTGMPWRIN